VAWPAILGVLLLAAGGIVLLVRRNSLGLVIALFFLILSPTLIIPNILEVAAERRMYLPLAAIFLWLIAAAYRGAQRWRGSRIPLVLAGVGLAVGWSVVSVRRAGQYEDEQTLWRENLRWAADDPVTQNSLGTALIDASGLRQHGVQFSTVTGAVMPSGVRMDMVDEAMHHFEEAYRLDPDSEQALNNLANVYGDEGRFDEAIAQYRQVLQHHWNEAYIHANLGMMLVRNRQPQQAIEELRIAISQDPKIAEAHNNLGSAFLAAGDSNSAINEYLEAIRLQPGQGNLYVNLSQAYATANYPRQAMAAAQVGIRFCTQNGQIDLANSTAKWLKDYAAQQKLKSH
jgi:tetratricopeptide (TPR) repeat protein